MVRHYCYGISISTHRCLEFYLGSLKKALNVWKRIFHSNNVWPYAHCYFAKAVNHFKSLISMHVNIARNILLCLPNKENLNPYAYAKAQTFLPHTYVVLTLVIGRMKVSLNSCSHSCLPGCVVHVPVFPAPKKYKEMMQKLPKKGWTLKYNMYCDWGVGKRFSSCYCPLNRNQKDFKIILLSFKLRKKQHEDGHCVSDYSWSELLRPKLYAPFLVLLLLLVNKSFVQNITIIFSLSTVVL